jgi:hypothetical protein
MQLASPVAPTRLGIALGAVVDILIVTAILWIPILALGALAALVRRVF